jgi:pimeloyl-ACP methyl ester carboxylesterase
LRARAQNPAGLIAPVTIDASMARILLIHGAFGGSWCWEPVAPRLREAGHEVEAIDLPGNGADPTPAAEVTLDAYAKRICDALASGPPAVLVGQSMGGMAITQAAARCPSRVVSLIYTAAFAPAEGQSLMDLVSFPEAAGDLVQANVVVSGDPPVAVLPPDGAKQGLYNCCTEEQASWAAAKLAPQPVQPWGDRLEVADSERESFERLPRAYITCLQDRAIMPAMQRRMYQAAGCDPVIELDADHAAWLSRTDEFVAAIEQIVAAVAFLTT